MSKKRAAEEQDSDSDMSIVNVDFEFFDPRPGDYMVLKRLLDQLFQGDAERLQTSGLAELIIAQPLVGTTVKVDGIDGDPYAYLTVLNLSVHKETSAVQALINYMLEKTAATNSFHETLQKIFSSTSNRPVGFVFSERLINMPVQTVPPMYQMLLREIQWAIDENEDFSFSHFLFISRTWRSQETIVHDDSTHPTPKRMKIDGAPIFNHDDDAGMQPYHPEDVEISKFASHTVDYEFSNRSQKSDVLGADMGGRMMLVPSDDFPSLVDALARAFPAP